MTESVETVEQAIARIVELSGNVCSLYSLVTTLLMVIVGLIYIAIELNRQRYR